MPAWALPAIQAGVSLIGGIAGSRSARSARRRQNELFNRALGGAEDRYNARSPFRDQALAALQNPGVDAMQYVDPDTYRYQGVGYSLSPFAQESRRRLQGADRLENVRGALSDFDRESEPVLAAQYRNARQAAASGGALGSGRLNTSIGDYTINRDRERDAYRNELLRDATDKQMEDLYRNEAIGREESDAQYERAVGERGFRTNLGRAGLQDRLAALGENRAQRSSQLAEALGLAEFGFADDDVMQILMQMAGLEGGNADRASGSASLNYSLLGQLLGQLQRRGTGEGGSGFNSPTNFNAGYGF